MSSVWLRQGRVAANVLLTVVVELRTKVKSTRRVIET